jgi:DNA-binding MarR family transcriptional regulator
MADNYISAFEEFERLLKSVWQKYHMYVMPECCGLSPVQIFLLKYVHDRKVCKPSEIALEFGITQGAVTGLTDRLLKLNLVHRERTEEDRRLVLISLTTRGIETVRDFDLQRRQKFGAIAKNLEDDHLGRLLPLLKKMCLSLDILSIDKNE